MHGSKFPRVLKVLRPTLTVIVAVLLLVPLMPGAKALTTPGLTQALVSPEQLIRDASSAIPVIGFNMTSDTGSDTLQTINVTFFDLGGFTGDDDNDLRRLDVNSGISGVGLYRDDGTIDDVLDAGDTPVSMDAIVWTVVGVPVSIVGIDLSATNNEFVPTAVTGLFHWFIVIRTADVPGTLFEGDAFQVRMEPGSIVATGPVSQPAAVVTSSALIVRLTRGVDMTGGGAWIGPGDVRVNEMAVLGLRIVDGGVGPYGIADRMVEMRVILDEVNGVLSSTDLQPLDPDGGISGLALYADDGPLEDEWDASDTSIVLADITPRTFLGATTFTLTTQAPGLDVPDTPAGPLDFLDFFLVVRTRQIVTGDDFTLQVPVHGITINGTTAQAGSVDAGLTTPIDSTLPSGLVMGDSTPPLMLNEVWVEASDFLFARGLDLFFTTAMPVPQAGDAEGIALDFDSGLDFANFSIEAGLAGSPPNQPLFGAPVAAYSGTYLFDATSTDANSPAVVTIFDAVGNNISSVDTGNLYNYISVTTPLLILPAPGWDPPAGTPTWVDANGKLWFSNLIVGTITVDLTVDLVSLSGAGLKNATASAEPSLAGGPTPGSVVYAPTPAEDTWTTSYDLNASSTDGSSPATIWVEDNAGNATSMAFEYGLDAAGPTISFLTPGPSDVLAGQIVVRVSVQDTETAVLGVQLAVDATGALQDMFFDGTAYFLAVPTVLFSDGAHRLIVRAEDMVMNVQAQGLDVVFDNTVDTSDPVVIPVTPAQGSAAQGLVTIQVFASDPQGLDRVDLTFNGQVVVMTFNAQTGYYEHTLDSTLLADGTYDVVVTATDVNGRSTTATFDFRISNTTPPLEGFWALLQQSALLLLILVIIVLFAVGAILFRRGRGPKPREE